MGNSAPDLLTLARDRGWEIAPTNDRDGVAQVIESVLESTAVNLAGDKVIETPA
jgi:hypothetical protein